MPGPRPLAQATGPVSEFKHQLFSRVLKKKSGASSWRTWGNRILTLMAGRAGEMSARRNVGSLVRHGFHRPPSTGRLSPSVEDAPCPVHEIRGGVVCIFPQGSGANGVPVAVWRSVRLRRRAGTVRRRRPSDGPGTSPPVPSPHRRRPGPHRSGPPPRGAEAPPARSIPPAAAPAPGTAARRRSPARSFGEGGRTAGTPCRHGRGSPRRCGRQGGNPSASMRPGRIPTRLLMQRISAGLRESVRGAAKHDMPAALAAQADVHPHVERHEPVAARLHADAGAGPARPQALDRDTAWRPRSPGTRTRSSKAPSIAAGWPVESGAARTGRGGSGQTPTRSREPSTAPAS